MNSELNLSLRDLAQIQYVYRSLANKIAKNLAAHPLLPSLRKRRKTEP
jgi:hypothetical protein